MKWYIKNLWPLLKIHPTLSHTILLKRDSNTYMQWSCTGITFGFYLKYASPKILAKHLSEYFRRANWKKHLKTSQKKLLWKIWKILRKSKFKLLQYFTIIKGLDRECFLVNFMNYSGDICWETIEIIHPFI